MPANEILAILMFVSFIALVFTGFPVAWILGGLAVLFSAFAVVLKVDFALPIAMDWAYTSLTVDRIWNVMENWVMVALPMFILMGLLLDRSGIAKQLMTSFARLFGGIRGGLAVTIALIGLSAWQRAPASSAHPSCCSSLLGLPVMLAARLREVARCGHGVLPSVRSGSSFRRASCSCSWRIACP